MPSARMSRSFLWIDHLTPWRRAGVDTLHPPCVGSGASLPEEPPTSHRACTARPGPTTIHPTIRTPDTGQRAGVTEVILWQCARCGACAWATKLQGHPQTWGRCLCQRDTRSPKSGAWRLVFLSGRVRLRRQEPRDPAEQHRWDQRTYRQRNPAYNGRVCPSCGGKKNKGTLRCERCRAASFPITV